MFFNPFSHLSISKLYPLAKLRRSTLQERFQDTFETIYGRMEAVGGTKNYKLCLKWGDDGRLTYRFLENGTTENGAPDYLSFLELSGTIDTHIVLKDNYENARSAFQNNKKVAPQLWPTLLKSIPYLKRYASSYGTEIKDWDEDGSLVLYSRGKRKENHIGIVDYLFFPILLPIAGYLEGNPGSSLAKVVDIIKIPVSFVLTLCVSPFIFLAAAISSCVNFFKDQEVDRLKIIATTEQSEEKIQVDSKTQKNVSQVSDRKNDDLMVDTRKVITETTTTTEIKKVRTKNRNLILADIYPPRREKASYAIEKVDDKPSCIALDPIDNEDDWFPARGHEFGFFDVKIPITEENKSALRWALESNYDRMLEKLVMEETEGVAQVDATPSKSL